MTNLDETLQQQLTALEQGVPLDQVLAALPPDAAELAPLIRLAAAARALDQPVLRPEVSRAQRALVENALPAAPRLISFLERFKNPRGFLSLGAAAAAMAVLIVILGLSLYLAGPASAHSARLVQVNGSVQASSAVGSDWRTVSENSVVTQGEHIRTGSAAGATLVFFDGSRTTIGPDSDLVLTALNGRWGNALEVQLTQKTGTTTNEVVPLRASGSFFRVDTPSGQASVHGTSFNVAVAPDGQSLFSVLRGKVQVQNASSKVLLTSGQATTALPGKTLDEPGYQFRLNGPLGAMTPTQWIVAGVPLTITPQTRLPSTAQVGDLAIARGRILSGQWVVDEIDLANQDHSPSHFTGLIEIMGPVPGAWIIGGQTVLVTPETELSKKLAVSDPVEVVFTVLPNQAGWLARSIESLEESEVEPSATPTSSNPSKTPTVTETPTATGTATETPTATETITGTPATPTATPTATATVPPKNETNRCDNRTQPQPEGLRLAQRYGVAYEEIIGWFCNGFGFGEIQQAYELSQTYNIPVAEIFRLRTQGLGWGQINKLVPQMAATDTPSSDGKDHGNQDKKGPKK
ncbi:MAG TPA: FecR family protein [Anaerolineaceae bacterium]|nr:FecR family protein [Anaerolineaceae bacterium]